MNKRIKMLFAFPIYTKSTSFEVYKSLKNNENIELYDLFDININTVYQNNGSSFIFKVMEKLKLPLDYYKINKKLLEYNLVNIDIVFTVKGNNIKPTTLKYIKKNNLDIKIISYSLDDMYAWHNRSIYYTLGLKYYDLIVTTKSYNVSELKSLGARNILFIYQAFSKDVHRLFNCKDVKNKYDILFVGFFEKERYLSMLYLSEHGVKVDIFGIGWEEYINRHNNLIIHNQMLLGLEYSEALSCSKVSLCFLRKINRDLHTSRSIEIPACGGFMLAERTDEHEVLFENGKEAVYFDTNEDLLKKVKYYLENEEKRKVIAKAGYDRTRSGDYSYNNMVEKILDAVKAL